jgi:hypothetical protein
VLAVVAALREEQRRVAVARRDLLSSPREAGESIVVSRRAPHEALAAANAGVLVDDEHRAGFLLSVNVMSRRNVTACRYLREPRVHGADRVAPNREHPRGGHCEDIDAPSVVAILEVDDGGAFEVTRATAKPSTYEPIRDDVNVRSPIADPVERVAAREVDVRRRVDERFEVGPRESVAHGAGAKDLARRVALGRSHDAVGDSRAPAARGAATQDSRRDPRDARRRRRDRSEAAVRRHPRDCFFAEGVAALGTSNGVGAGTKLDASVDHHEQIVGRIAGAVEDFARREGA